MKANREHQKQKHHRMVQHPLFGIATRQWIKLVKKNGGIDRIYLDRALFITITSLFTAPVRFLFKIKYEEKLLWREIKNQKCLFRNQNVDFCA